MKIFSNKDAWLALLILAALPIWPVQAQSETNREKASSNTVSATPTKRDKEVVRRELMDLFFAGWDAATWGQIRKLLEEEPTLINARGGFSSLLHRASQEGNLAAAEWLISHGLDVNIPSGGGSTPLFHVQDVKMAQLLLEHGADVDVENEGGRTALFEILASPLYFHPERGDAQREESERIALLLMKYGADLNVEDHNGNTIFHALAQGRHYQWLGHNLRRGVGAKAKNKFGVGIWSAPLSRGENSVLDWLERNGVTYDPQDQALVRHVVAWGNKPMTKKLQKKGLDINAPDGLSGLTLLEKEIVKGYNTNAFNMLLECGARIGDANKKHGGKPLLHWAVVNLEFTKYLLDHGADVDAKDYKGMLPLFAAVIRGSPETTNLLLAHGADINQVLVTESDTLSWVGWRDETKHDFVRLHQVTPLLLAVCGFRQDALETVLANGVDVNLRTSEGYTALMVAEKRHDKKRADLLRQHGAVE